MIAAGTGDSLIDALQIGFDSLFGHGSVLAFLVFRAESALAKIGQLLLP
jgi:hypothetical protein